MYMWQLNNAFCILFDERFICKEPFAQYMAKIDQMGVIKDFDSCSIDTKG